MLLQVDLFLCGDGQCNTVAVLVNIESEGMNDVPSLAVGYIRFPLSLVAVPARYMDSNATSRLVAHPDSYLEASGFVAKDVVWKLPSLQWVEANPVITPFSIWVIKCSSQASNLHIIYEQQLASTL